MYAKFFGLNREPFSIAPDPRYLFMSERHREALAHLLYGLGGGGGFVLLTGEIGAGKTTVCRCFLEQIPPSCNVAYIFNPKLTVTELLKSVCDEFHVATPQREPGAATVKDHVDPLNRFLLDAHAAGKNNVLIIDEAQSLSADVLEQLRLLTNLETNERKLLQIVLIGQPELRTMLARPELEQLAQRVIARFHLDALALPETRRYIAHRLAVAGLAGAGPFDDDAQRRIHALSRGVPRRINMLCDRALLGAYALGRSRVNRKMLEQAAREVFDSAPARREPGARRAVTVGLAVLAVVAGATALGAAGLALDGLPRRALEALKAHPATVTAPPAGDAPSTPPAHSPVGTGVGAAPAATAFPPAATPAPSPAAVSAASAPAPSAQWLGPRELQARFTTQHRVEADAWRELAPAWQLALEPGEPCVAAAKLQVQCYRSASSTLALIRQIARPGILTLYDDENRPFFALLTGLTEDSATLRMGGTQHRVALLSLAGLWRGEFATFWRTPPGYSNPIADGASRSTSQWLGAQFDKLEAAAAPAARPASGSALKARVLAFQIAHGLRPDGLAGPTTLMQLNRAVGIAEPRLNTQG
jgi:general secretion pathway protein A